MINWKYVKGLWGNDDGNGNNTSLYTFLEFQNNTGSTDFAKAPVIKINDTNTLPTDDAEGNDFGHIITEKARGQFIKTAFEFWNELKLSKDIDDHAKLLLIGKTQDNSASSEILEIQHKHTPSIHLKRTVNNKDVYLVGDSGAENGEFAISFAMPQSGYFDKKFRFTEAGNAYIPEKCEAKYYNATSDIRAKTDIKILDINALDLIKKVKLYSFTYKDTNSKSIGVIAQELQSISIDGFKLVENENATGKDMDYMTVHESKIVYILWKAIQEQQKEIEDLKLELKKRG